MRYLAADIGGTYSRLAWFGDGVSHSEQEQTFRNADFDSLEAVIDHAQEIWQIAGTPLDHMVLAVPGPIHNDPVTLTNIDWQLARAALRSRYATARLSVVNDFQAAALGAAMEPRERLRTLNPAKQGGGPVVVAGAGTGLGMAWFPDRKTQALPQATEGGHLDFAPNNADQLALYRWLAQHYGHVSYERVLSGKGLVETYSFFADNNADLAEPAEIAAAARLGDKHAGQALQTFVEVFAAYAGNLALAFNPTGGIYLCGGLTVHLAEWFDRDRFQAAYAAKGRMRNLVQRIPVFMVTRHDTGLMGARMIAKNMTGQIYE
jgi:glucokinase